MIKFLIICFLIFLLFRLVMPHLLRWALKAFLKRTIRNGTFMQGNPMQAKGPFTRSEPAPEGQIKVDFVPDNGPAAKPNEFRGGEYVDYEEVK